MRGGSVIVDFSILHDASGTAFSTDVLSEAITTGLSIANATLTSGVEITSTPQLSTTSTVMTHEEHNLTFIPGGPAGTVAINGTHHTTSTGDVIEAINSTHHIASDGLVTSHVEANLTREFHGLTDEHLDNHTAAGSTHDLVHHFHPSLLEDPEIEPPTHCTARIVVQSMVDKAFNSAEFYSTPRAEELLGLEVQQCRDVIAASSSLSRKAVSVKPACRCWPTYTIRYVQSVCCSCKLTAPCTRSRTAQCDFKELLESNSIENLRACAEVMDIVVHAVEECDL